MTQYAPPAGYEQQPASDYPIQVTFDRPEHSSRVLALFSIPWFLVRYLLLIPQFFVLIFVGFASAIVVWIAFWAVLFTGSYPEGMYRFNSGVLRWQTRVNGYLFGLTDKYPPFRLSP